MSLLLFSTFDALDEGDEDDVEVTRVLTKAVEGGLLDMALDPITLDYIDTDDGEWLEVSDSRTMVMIQLEQRLGESWESPGDGTSIQAELEEGDPVTPEFIAAEYERALALLVQDGLIADVVIAPVRDDFGNPIVDEAGRFLMNVSWRDLPTGSIVDDFVF
jgi:hypothetical protein